MERVIYKAQKPVQESPKDAAMTPSRSSPALPTGNGPQIGNAVLSNQAGSEQGSNPVSRQSPNPAAKQTPAEPMTAASQLSKKIPVSSTSSQRNDSSRRGREARQRSRTPKAQPTDSLGIGAVPSTPEKREASLPSQAQPREAMTPPKSSSQAAGQQPGPRTAPPHSSGKGSSSSRNVASSSSNRNVASSSDNSRAKSIAQQNSDPVEGSWKKWCTACGSMGK